MLIHNLKDHTYEREWEGERSNEMENGVGVVESDTIEFICKNIKILLSRIVCVTLYLTRVSW